jgi:hypothetical protein
VEEEVAGWDRAIFHTRAASTGGVTLDNQHPFVFHAGEPGTPEWERTVCGIHNGIISNHLEMNQKYSRGFEVDSMHIYKHLAERRVTSELTGYGNLAWYEFRPDDPTGTLYFLRFNSSDLHVAKMVSGEVVFCSERDPIERAAKMCGGEVKVFHTLEEEHVYFIRHSPEGEAVLYKSAKVPFGPRSSYSANRGRGYDIWDGRHTHTSGGCGSAPSHHLARRKELLSGVCGVTGCSEKVPGTRKVALVCVKHWTELTHSTTPTPEVCHV